jgi:hypothetical protein
MRVLLVHKFYICYHWPRHITKNNPQVVNGSNSNQENEEQSNKFDAERSSHKYARWWQPEPPTEAKRSVEKKTQMLRNDASCRQSVFEWEKETTKRNNKSLINMVPFLFVKVSHRKDSSWDEEQHQWIKKYKSI